MNDAEFVHLPDRAVVALTGPDTRDFLQVIVTNDVDLITNQQAIYAALLTPQGKVLHDFFIVQHKDALLLDCAYSTLDGLMRRLKMYKLRADVTITDATEHFSVYASLGIAGLKAAPGHTVPFGDGVAFVDPRIVAMGTRFILPKDEGESALKEAGFTPGTRGNYDARRLSLGIGEGGKGVAPETLFPLEAGFEELHGVSFTKGCYVGQEVTSRMKSRSLVRKRLLPVTIDGEIPEPGCTLYLGEKPGGEFIGGAGHIGLALVRLEALTRTETDGTFLTDGETSLKPTRPDWANL
jgi:hypothetical protein